MTFGKLLQSTLALALGASTLAGCGAAHNALAPIAAKRAVGLHYASKALKDAFPYRMGWEAPAATPIVDDRKTSGSERLHLGFSVKDVTPTKSVDLRPMLSPVGDQGNFGSCTSFAMVKGIGEFMELKQIRAKGGDTAKDFVPLSPRFLWYDERSFMGRDKVDTGATMFLGMNQLVSDGTCAESSFPYCAAPLQKNELYRNYFLAEAPSKAIEAEARQHRGGQLRQLTKLSDIKASLDDGYPAVFGFVVFSSIRQAAKTGILPMPSLQDDEVMGGHATVAVGYDDAKGCLILRNSWGGDWGDHGYFYMPYDYFNTQFGLVADGWTMRETN
jgi:C1A family cysteine protease